MFFCYKITKGQPTVLGTDAITYPTYGTYDLTDFGKFYQYKFQAVSTISSNTSLWLFAKGTAASTDYSVKWNPYAISTSKLLASYDSIVPPNTLNGAALMTTFGAADGKFPAITSGNYYTVNISDSIGDNYLAVWETTFNPTLLSVVVQNPTIVCEGGDSVAINVTSNQTLNISENAYLRYAYNNNFTASSLVPLTFTSTNGTAKIPVPSATNTIYFYVFTSKYSLTKLAPSGVVNERYCDLSSLSLNNNSNSNYSFTVISSAVPNTDFTSNNYCVGLATTFNNTSSILSGSISTYAWNFGNGNTSSSSASPLTNTYLSTGNYTVTLIATSNLGCQKTSTQTITINPLPTANSINAN